MVRTFLYAYTIYIFRLAIAFCVLFVFVVDGGRFGVNRIPGDQIQPDWEKYKVKKLLY